MSHINQLTIAVAAIAGSVSAVHCVGMCSGIAGALTASLPASIRDHPVKLTSYIAVYNLGRIFSYGLAGLFVGLFSGIVFQFLDAYWVQWISKMFATFVLLMVGLHLLGALHRFTSIEKVGRALWQYLQPYAQSLLPVKRLKHAFLFGMVWGWLPCGLVYTMLMWTLAAGGPIQGLTTMIAFGVGTFPTLIIASVLSSWIFKGNRLVIIRGVTGSIMIMLAMGAFLLPGHDALNQLINRLHN